MLEEPECFGMQFEENFRMEEDQDGKEASEAGWDDSIHLESLG